jgi:hypothetical protein
MVALKFGNSETLSAHGDGGRLLGTPPFHGGDFPYERLKLYRRITADFDLFSASRWSPNYLLG